MSAEVIIELSGKEVARVPLKGTSMVIGRDPSADIHLDNLALSRRHAEIERRGAAIWIRDLESQNGTYVNGERVVGQRALNVGDAIELGRYKLSIAGVDAVSNDAPVLTLTGPDGTHRFAMVANEVILGRSPSCDIPIRHKSISRQHLRISMQGGRFTAEDLGSQNGTRLGGALLRGPTPFEPGDQLQMSDFIVEVGYMEAGGEGGRASDGSGQTMMIDRSELVKAAYVEGDFEQMRGGDDEASAVQPAGRGRDPWAQETAYETRGRDESVTRGGLPSAPELTNPRHPAPAPRRPEASTAATGRAPAQNWDASTHREAEAYREGPPPRDPAHRPPAGRPAPMSTHAAEPLRRAPPPAAPRPAEPPPARRPEAPRHAEPMRRRSMHVVFVHPDFPERHLELVDDVTVFAEDGAMLGSMPDAALARAFADQAYVLVFRSDHGAYVCAAGDRRLVAVNGTPQLYAPLREGDTVEFGHTVLVVQGD